MSILNKSTLINDYLIDLIFTIVCRSGARKALSENHSQPVCQVLNAAYKYNNYAWLIVNSTLHRFNFTRSFLFLKRCCLAFEINKFEILKFEIFNRSRNQLLLYRIITLYQILHQSYYLPILYSA